MKFHYLNYLNKETIFLNNNAWMTMDVMEINIYKIYKEYIYKATDS